jgi:hypothetical protein
VLLSDWPARCAGHSHSNEVWNIGRRGCLPRRHDAGSQQASGPLSLRHKLTPVLGGSVVKYNNKGYCCAPVPLEFVPVPQVETELYRERNIRPSFGLGGGLYGGLAYSALEAYLLRGRAPWTLRHRYSDHEKLRPAANCAPRDYPKPDAQITFDLNTSLFRFVDRLVQAY